MEDEIKENIKDAELVDEIEELMAQYGAEVLTERALPDARDGLKPVHRHFMFAMYKANLFYKNETVKSSNVVGDTLGKYHPHGDIPTYLSIVRAAQDFSLRYPLVFKQGNFGSIDGDSPAAHRYTEVKMSKIAEELVRDLDKMVVPVKKNYDERLYIPVVMPCFFPNLLVNGSFGIGFGMATSIPPHNLGEIISATIAVIKDPEISIKTLLDEHICGPDFPTGAMIIYSQRLVKAYETGRGSVIIRGKTHVEKVSSNCFLLVITEIPYLLKKTNLVVEIAKLVETKVISNVVDIRDETNREGIRIVVEFKKEKFIEHTLHKLYKLTSLQKSLHINFCALSDNVPSVFNLKQLLLIYIQHQLAVIRNRTRFEIDIKDKRLFVVEGFVRVINNYDKTIKIIRDAKTSKKDGLQKLMNFLKISEEQANNIWKMPLGSLAHFETEKLIKEKKNLLVELEALSEVLTSEPKQRKILVEQLLNIKKKFSDPRRTIVLRDIKETFSEEESVLKEKILITLSNNGYIKRVSLSAYRLQKRNIQGKRGLSFTEDDSLKLIKVSSTHDDLLFFTNKGKCYRKKAYKIPDYEREAKGIPVINVIETLGKEEIVQEILITEPSVSSEMSLFFVTKRALVKKTKLSEFFKIRKTGKIAISLGKKDELKKVFIVKENTEVFISSYRGKVVRFNTEDEIKLTSRNTIGVIGMQLQKGDFVSGADSFDKDQNKNYVLTVSESGIGKLISEDKFLVVKRFCVGKWNWSKKKILEGRKEISRLIAIKLVDPKKHDLFISTNTGKVKRIKLEKMFRKARNAIGVRLIKLRNTKHKVISISLVDKELSENVLIS